MQLCQLSISPLLSSVRISPKNISLKQVSCLRRLVAKASFIILLESSGRTSQYSNKLSLPPGPPHEQLYAYSLESGESRGSSIPQSDGTALYILPLHKLIHIIIVFQSILFYKLKLMI